MRRAALLGAAWLLLYILATALTTGNLAARRLVGNVIYLVPIIFAVRMSVRAVQRTSGRRQHLWLLLVASNSLWLAGDLLWTAYVYLLHHQPPTPSVADALYLLSYALVPAAVFVGFGAAGRRRRTRSLLDAAVVGLGLGTLGWQYLVAPQAGSGLTWATLTNMAYPLLGVVIVITLISVGFAGHRQDLSVWLVGAAFTVSALTDAGYTYFSALHEYISGDWLNLGWQLEALLLCLAASCAARRSEKEVAVAELGPDVTIAPVIVGLAGALVAISVDELRRGASIAIPILVCAVVVALVARFLLSAADTRRVALRLHRALQDQRRLVITDGLTGLYNRRHFEEVLQRETDDALRTNGRLALALLDLDHFKLINDHYGHRSGDAVLEETAARLQRAARSVDVVARYGGEEFALILPGADLATAQDVAERCRAILSETPVPLKDGMRITITGSFGLACLPGDAADLDSLVRYADQSVYAAKNLGRNRVQHLPGPIAPPPHPADSDRATALSASARPPSAIASRPT